MSRAEQQSVCLACESLCSGPKDNCNFLIVKVKKENRGDFADNFRVPEKLLYKTQRMASTLRINF